MKKNTFMRLASMLLVLTLLTTCVISGTFAKYTSDATTATNTARVAKWGWGDTTIALDLFEGAYDGTVQTANGDELIAPGTSKTAELTFAPAATFAPEVDYTLSFAVTANVPADIEAELDWTLTIDGAETNYTSFADLKNALEAKTYAGEAATAAPTVDIEIGWAWAFNGGDDVADTTLGNEADLQSLSVAVTMTATQVN